jgi:O-antigen/teichoic acid export membrane protein
MIAIVVLLGGFINIGVVYFAKELDFHKKFYFNTICTIIASVVTITLALIYRNVWALVFGKIVGSVINMILSYVMHPYRPRLSFDIKKFKTLWGYGKHVFATQLMKFFCLHGDDAILAKMLGLTALGFYQKAYEVGNLVAVEIGNKVAEVGFSAYSKLQDNIEKVRAGYLKSVQLTSLVVFPITGILVVLAPELVVNIIGDKWLDMVPAMRILCFFAPLRCMQRAPVFMGTGRPDILKTLTFIRLIIMAVSIYPLTKYYGMVGTAVSVFLPVSICEPMGYYYIDKLIGAKPIDVFRRFVLPLSATIIMSVCLIAAKTYFDSVGMSQLIVLLGMAGIVYLAMIIAGRFLGRDYDVIKLVNDVRKGVF